MDTANAHLQGHEYAKSALDIALWDLTAQAAGLPLFALLGGRRVADMLLYHSITCTAPGVGALDAVAIKLSKFGGISKARQARDLCVHLGAKMCIEDTWGSDIATTAALHLAAATPAKGLLNTCDLSGYVHPRLDPAAPTRSNGRIAPPESAGLGVASDRDTLGKQSLVLE